MVDLKKLIYGLIIVCALSPDSANAGLVFSFQFDQSNYNVSPGGTVDVGVILRQSGTADTGETNVLGGTGAVGMTGTGVLVTYPTGADDAQVQGTSDVSGNAAFDNFGFGPFIAVSAGSALLSQSTSGSPVLGTAVAGHSDTYDLVLGTFRFTAGSVSGQVTPITASIPLFPNANDNVAATDPPTPILVIADGGATITVTGGVVNPVPEPATLAPALVAVMVVAAFGLRRGASSALFSRAA